MPYNLIFIDDEFQIRQMFPYMANWEQLGFNPPRIFSDIKSAREYIQSNPVHLIISDIVLNDESGLDFAKEISEEHPKTLVVFLSGHRNFEFAQKAILLNAFSYLVKPLSFEDLNDTLQNAVKRLESEIAETQSFDDITSKAIKYIKANIQNENLSRTEISNYLGITPQHFSAVFKKQTGRSFISYVTELKINYAIELLKDPFYRIYEIRNMCGFKDSNYFTTLFKKHTGYTPADYRRHFYHIDSDTEN